MPHTFPTQAKAVDVTDWAPHEDFSVFPIGSKPKRLLLCPGDAHEGFLVPGHAYLFKSGTGRFEQQAWSEVIAYRLAALLGVQVPPCFIATDERAGETGALIEFFYGYPGELSPTRFVHASDFMTRILMDKKRGRPHRLVANLLLSRALCGEAVAREWWAKALAFDTLIGNTDRHPDNWGFLFRRNNGELNQISLAPLFDNGTSLGYEIAEVALTRAVQPERVRTYIGRGTHHCGWLQGGPIGHFELCREFLRFAPNTANVMRNLLQFDLADVQSVLEECTSYATGTKFSRERAALVFSLIHARKLALADLLEG